MLIALGYSGLFFCVQLFGRGTGGMDPEWHGFQLNGARYILLPFLLVTTVILVLPTRRRSAWARPLLARDPVCRARSGSQLSSQSTSR